MTPLFWVMTQLFKGSWRVQGKGWQALGLGQVALGVWRPGATWLRPPEAQTCHRWKTSSCGLALNHSSLQAKLAKTTPATRSQKKIQPPPPQLLLFGQLGLWRWKKKPLGGGWHLSQAIRIAAVGKTVTYQKRGPPLSTRSPQ